MEFIYPWIAIFAGLMILSVLLGWSSGLHQKYEIKKIKRCLEKRKDDYRRGLLEERKWLADFVGECASAFDELRENCLHFKKRPARKAAEVVREVKVEKREIVTN